MGTWGAGNLDDDTAMDELNERTHMLVASVVRRAKRKRSREADEWEHHALFVDFEMIFALDAKKLMVNTNWPASEEVEALKLEFIKGWDDSIDNYDPQPEHKANRRKCILKTFNRFKKICSRIEQQGSEQLQATDSKANLKLLLGDVDIAEQVVFNRLLLHIPENWKVKRSKNLSVAPKSALVHRFADPKSKHGLAIKASARSKVNHHYAVKQAFYASGRSLVPDKVPTAHDPYLLLGLLESTDQSKMPPLDKLFAGAESDLKKFYKGQDEGDYCWRGFGGQNAVFDFPVGLFTFREPPNDKNRDNTWFQSVLLKQASDNTLMLLEYGNQGACGFSDSKRDFPDALLLKSLLETIVFTS